MGAGQANCKRPLQFAGIPELRKVSTGLTDFDVWCQMQEQAGQVVNFENTNSMQHYMPELQAHPEHA